MGRNAVPRFDVFALECHSAETEPFKLQMQCDYEGNILFRHAFDIRPGHNYYEIPFGEFGISPRTSDARIFLYPENDRRCRLIFSWLDFVRFAPRPAVRNQP